MESQCRGRQQSIDAFAGLARLAADRRKPRVTIAEIVEAMGTSNTLMLMLLFALPNAFPMLPGTSTILGMPLLFLTVQLATGMRPRVPHWLGRRSLRRSHLEMITKRLNVLLSWSARLSPPRMERFAGALAIRVAGGLGVLLCVVLILPLPLVNVPIGA